MKLYNTVLRQQCMQCRECMCQRRCRQMPIFNCIDVDKLTIPF